MSLSADPVVVLADDDPDLLDMLEYRFSDWGYEVHCAQTSQQLQAVLSKASTDLVLLDLHFGEERGLDVLSQLLKDRFTAPVIILTAHGSIETAIQAIKLGAYDYLTKPPNLPQLRLMAQDAIAKHRLRTRIHGIEALSERQGSGQPMLGDSQKMQRVRQIINEAAPSNATILILGESGTGKELVAQAIHRQSPRAKRSFVPVNMAALPPNLAEGMLFGHEKGAFTGADSMQLGWCELADQGTLFLDEIGEMDISLQAKLLRFLQEKQIQRVGSSRAKSVDVRVVAATNRDPLILIREGRLREDLYYRLNVIPIELPPLRERREEVPMLATYFAARTAEANGRETPTISPEALVAFERYDWPGNVRQLENMIQRLVILSNRPHIIAEMLPREFFPDGVRISDQLVPNLAIEDDGLRLIDRLEKQAILDALESCQGNVVQAGQLLRMGQATIYRKIKRYEIEPKRWRH